MIRHYSTVLLLALAITGCQPHLKHPKPAEQELAQIGNDVATISQQTLFRNVSAAMKRSGAEYALDFCNLRAMPLTDSLSAAHGMAIQRITDRSRNPQNTLKTENDHAVFRRFSSTGQLQDTLVIESGKPIYYKRISIGMPACTKCHGIPQKEIQPATLKKILALYPKDQATGYQLNDLRGLWKISFNQK